MNSVPNEPVVGRFSLNGESYWGQLQIAGSDTRLTLYGDSHIPWSTKRLDCLFGELVDGSSVTLLDVIRMGAKTTHSKSKQHHSITLYPHYVIKGWFHQNPKVPEITGVSFSITDGSVLFYDSKAFGAVHGRPELLAEMLKAYRGDESIDLGDFPSVSYFSGNQTIVSVPLHWGELQAWHSFSQDSSGVVGNRDVTISFDFSSPRTFESAIEPMIRFVRFSEMVTGRPQTPRECSLRYLEAEGEGYRGLELYWCTNLSKYTDRDFRDSRLSPFELPVNGGLHKDEFVSVFKNWFNSCDDKIRARTQICNSLMGGNHYTFERLVSSANAFDLLPDDLFPKGVPISEEMRKARDGARALFRALPDSPERQSVLGALGRVGSMTLKRKIRHRAARILPLARHGFQSLEKVIDRAVDFRNFLVHGSDSGTDWSNVDLPFLVDTLEFVFVFSDLLDCGLDGRRFLDTPSSGGAFLLNYAKDFELRAHTNKLSLGLS